MRKIRHYSTELAAPLPEIAYIVKLYLATMPPPDDMGYELYIGDQQIRKYTQFNGGIYFKITNPEQLAMYRGQKVRFRRPGAAEFIATEVAFPVIETRPRDAEDLRERTLPSQDDVLRE